MKHDPALPLSQYVCFAPCMWEESFLHYFIYGIVTECARILIVHNAHIVGSVIKPFSQKYQFSQYIYSLFIRYYHFPLHFWRNCSIMVQPRSVMCVRTLQFERKENLP